VPSLGLFMRLFYYQQRKEGSILPLVAGEPSCKQGLSFIDYSTSSSLTKTANKLCDYWVFCNEKLFSFKHFPEKFAVLTFSRPQYYRD
jgi:hypothetical protein